MQTLFDIVPNEADLEAAYSDGYDDGRESAIKLALSLVRDMVRHAGLDGMISLHEVRDFERALRLELEED